jgi:hypothetical protein
MHRPIPYHLMQARATRQARRARRYQPGHPVSGLAASRADAPQNSGGHLLQDRIACERGRSS